MSLTFDENRWCDWMKEREQAYARPDVWLHSESVYAFKTGASRERARIRRELQEWLVGDHPEDAGIICGRRVLTEIDRIFGKES